MTSPGWLCWLLARAGWLKGWFTGWITHWLDQLAGRLAGWLRWLASSCLGTSRLTPVIPIPIVRPPRRLPPPPMMLCWWLCWWLRTYMAVESVVVMPSQFPS
ncbi:hypothetical protein EDB80DRAFT_156451 [Ilyonectria destructans]|nr:hypothetical protein EDB80DRAFT_156451 [Ilyonectria destructans]